MELVIASKNVHKVSEFRTLLKKLEGIDLYSLRDFPDYVQPPETGATFEANATIKAEHAAQNLGKIVLADDSGLVVLALDGAPGVYSARYAGAKATDQDNRDKLLKAMEDLKGEARRAYFECCIVIAHPDGKKKVVTGVCEGTILDHEEGEGGFGYDPLFIKDDYNKTFAQLSPETKNRISHRGKAFEKALIYLESFALKQS